MGPRFIDRGKGAPSPLVSPDTLLLQWGRGSSTAERSQQTAQGSTARKSFNGAAVHRPRKEAAAAHRDGRRKASMGPRFIDRGKAAGLDVFRYGLPSFNGAAVHRPRKASSERSSSPKTARFNGAAVHRPRKELDAEEDQISRIASMGPRFIDRGKPVSGAVTANAGTLQWGRGSSTAERSLAARSPIAGIRFNGAAVHRPRKDAGVKGQVVGLPASFNGAAVHRPRKALAATLGVAIGSASMGPRFIDRGKAAAWRWPRVGPASFNGAAVHRPRKGRSCRRSHSARLASMGPRFIDRGKALRFTVTVAMVKLQWGRGSSTAERTKLSDSDREGV